MRPADAPPMRRLTVMLRSDDRAHLHSLAIEVLALAKRANMAGATLLEDHGAHEGRGAHGHGAHEVSDAGEGPEQGGSSTRPRHLGEGAPLTVVIVDTSDRISSFFPSIADLAGAAAIEVDDVSAYRL
ncbi:MAG TPA: DUF190 domain-containing protein [Acidimicrobiales bacterium]|nr:DUF190 domain-containing protein [Acidimicrobiales bacterium]